MLCIAALLCHNRVLDFSTLSLEVFCFRLLGSLITCYMLSNFSIHIGKIEMVDVFIVRDTLLLRTY